MCVCTVRGDGRVSSCVDQRALAQSESDLLEDDADLAASLARARRVAQKSTAQASEMDDGETDVLDVGAKRIRAVLTTDKAFVPKEVPCTCPCHRCLSDALVSGFSPPCCWPVVSAGEDVRQ